MKKLESLKQTAKTIEQLSESTIETLKSLTEEKVIIDFKDMDCYSQVQILVKEGFIQKDYRQYSITTKGKELLENIEYAKTNTKRYQEMIKESVKKDNCVTITYKKHDEENDIICNESVSYDLEKDGIPVVKVNSESYANLINRVRGQHWKQYLGEDARQLIRQKKLERFYVEDEKNGRRYLYIMPK